MARKSKRGRRPGPTRLISIDGVSRSLSEWSELYGVPATTILERIRCGWTWERAVIKRARRYRTRVEVSDG